MSSVSNDSGFIFGKIILHYPPMADNILILEKLDEGEIGIVYEVDD
jgi:hypothetical protein